MTYLLIFNPKDYDEQPAIRKLIEELESRGHKVVAEPLRADDARVLVFGGGVWVSLIGDSTNVKSYSNTDNFINREFFV